MRMECVEVNNLFVAHTSCVPARLPQTVIRAISTTQSFSQAGPRWSGESYHCLFYMITTVHESIYWKLGKDAKRDQIRHKRSLVVGELKTKRRGVGDPFRDIISYDCWPLHAQELAKRYSRCGSDMQVRCPDAGRVKEARQGNHQHSSLSHHYRPHA